MERLQKTLEMMEAKRKELRYILKCLNDPKYKDHEILIRVEGKLRTPEDALAIYMVDITIYEKVCNELLNGLKSDKKICNKLNECNNKQSVNGK